MQVAESREGESAANTKVELLAQTQTPAQTETLVLTEVDLQPSSSQQLLTNNVPLPHLYYQMGAAFFSTFISQSALYLPGILGSGLSTIKFAHLYSHTVLRMINFNNLVFMGKVALDWRCKDGKWANKEYAKGGVVGFLSFLIWRPFDQMHKVRMDALKEGKIIQMVEAAKSIRKLYGGRGFYHNENLFAPLSSTMHRALMFGLSDRLAKRLGAREGEGAEGPQFLTKLILSPFLASIGSSLACFHVDKLRRYFLQKHTQRQRALIKGIPLNCEHESVAREFAVQLFAGKIGYNMREMAGMGLSILRNGVSMTLFLIGQHYVNLKSQGHP